MGTMTRCPQFWRWIFCAFVIAEINGFLNNGVTAALIPEVTRISPDSGPTDGGFEVTASGLFVNPEGLIIRNGVTCQFGLSSVNATVINARTITCTAPSSGVGDISFAILVNGQQWTNTTLTFNYYNCSTLTGSNQCATCFALPLCGICIPTGQCSSEIACAGGFIPKCPEITNISPNSTSIVSGTNLTITFDIAMPSVHYYCAYGSTIGNTNTIATLISSNTITCQPPFIGASNWLEARGSNRELVVDMVISGDTLGFIASKQSSVFLFDCDTYGQDCESCNSMRTNNECSFCFDAQECHYSSVSCLKNGTCPAITNVSPSRIYISAVQSGATLSLAGVFSYLSGQTFYCAFNAAGDIIGSANTTGTLVTLTSLTCNIHPSLTSGSNTVSIWMKNSLKNAVERLTPNFPFNVYDCQNVSCTTCLDGTRPECVYCTGSASCNHISNTCSAAEITSVSSCPTISIVLPDSVPTIGGISIAVNGSFDTSVLIDPTNVTCVWNNGLSGTDVVLAYSVTSNGVQCLAPSVDHPTVGSVHLAVLDNTEPWTNSLPFSWFECANITSSCDECVGTSPTCKWCVTHCATDCGASHAMSVCPIITSITPSFIRVNSIAQQTIRVTGGPFYDDLNYECLFDDLTAASQLVNESTIDCNVPVFLTGNTTLRVVANNVPYTNAAEVEVYDCLNVTSSLCSAQCIQQAHCGWCVATSTCTSLDLCAQEDVFLDACLQITVSPVFDPTFDTTATIVASPHLPQVWFSSKRSTLFVSDIYCELSTGDSIPATIANETTLMCDIPKLTTNESVTLTITYQNQTLVAPVALQTFDCSPFMSCEQCPSSQCTWCGSACVIDYRCSQRQNCDVLIAPTTSNGDTGGVKPEVVAPAVVVPTVVVVVVIVLVVLLKRRKKRKSSESSEMTTVNNEKLLQEAEKKRLREEKQRLAEEKKTQREEQRRHKEAEKLRLEAKRLQDKADKRTQGMTTQPSSSMHVEQTPGSTHYNSIEATPSKRKKDNMIPVLDSINEKMKIPFDSLEMKREVGSGSYGKVYLGQWQGAKVAIKVCASVANIDGFFDEAVLTIGLPPHPNVVQTFGISVDGKLPCIVLEYCGGGSLDKKIFDEDGAYSFEDKVRLIKGIAHGLLHLHKHNIVHRDLAARNILLTRGGKPKISDFGMSRLLKEESQKGQTKSTVGPLRWMAPEGIIDSRYSTKSDVWTFGILMHEILSGSEPHTGMDIIDVAMKIKNEFYHPVISPDWNEHLKSILLSCWQPDPEQRPTMQEIAKKLQEQFASGEDSE